MRKVYLCQLLYHRFLDMGFMEPRFDATMFNWNISILLRHREGTTLFEEADRRGLMSDERLQRGWYAERNHRIHQELQKT